MLASNIKIYPPSTSVGHFNMFVDVVLHRLLSSPERGLATGWLVGWLVAAAATVVSARQADETLIATAEHKLHLLHILQFFIAQEKFS